MSQLRLNPLTGRWVTIVASRGHRPTDFAPRLSGVEADASAPCPFCPGNEEATPPALATYDENGSWQLRVVPNRYPAFDGEESLAVRNLGPVHVQAEASGIHEVFIYSPDHNGNFGTLSNAAASDAMNALRERFIAHAQVPNIRYSQAIVNHGREAGASLSHPHGQILGMPFVPGDILDEERGFVRFVGGCILCATVEAELASGDRVLFVNDDVAIVCPFWSGTPFEMLVIPRDHQVHLQDATPESLSSVGIGLRDAIAALNEAEGDIAYNLVVHTAPHSHNGPFHWHIHIFPQLNTVAGFERGTGVLINIVAPEEAAKDIRAALPAHAR